MEKLLTAVNDAQGSVEGSPETENATQSPAENSAFRERRIKAENEAMAAAAAEQQARAELERVEGELLELKQKMQLEELENDLRCIKESFPDETADSVYELGNEYLHICASGVDPVTAYEFIRFKKEKLEGAPPSTGDLNPVSNPDEYLSPEQVKRMTPEQVKKNYSKIRNSMNRWKE